MRKKGAGMVLYIHGFASCGESTKSGLLKKCFASAGVLSPDLPADPDEAVSLLEALIRQHAVDLLIGSSLGGYYADWLAQRHGIKAVLINPSTRPYETLAPYVGTNHRWCDGRPFEWKAAYLERLKHYDVAASADHGSYLVLLQTGDEVLDYRLAERKYGDAELIVQEGGSHRFENLGDYLEKVERFYRR